uniref:Nucleotidyl transferase domain-containing protein n=1 Tax=viral metagenome TaxID=1070528 RepID=A0A6C0KXY8_9ZZZZ
MNVIIPMAGLGSRFTKYGFSMNKYLLPIDKRKTKMIEIAILSLNVPKNSNFIFILKEDKEEDISLREFLKELCKKYSYNCKILSINYLTEGPASTAYLAKEYIDNDVPLIISNSDQILDWNYNNFINKSMNYDGCVLTYKPNYELIIGNVDKHSFVRFDEITKIPVEFVEKKVISNEALVGVHYYKKGSYFIKSAEYIFFNNIRAPNGEFYLSYTYQALINMKYNIGTYCLSETEFFYPVGEPEDYFKYYNSTSLFFYTNILNYNIINNNFFIICEGVKNDTIQLSNSLFIPFTDSYKNVYLTGENMNYRFTENMYYLKIPNINYTNEKSEKLIDLNKYTRGWLIGNFEPSIKKTTDFEIGILNHKKDEKWDFHYHSETKEINILLSGEMIINNIPIFKDTIFIFEKDIISCPLFITDCVVLCIKLPSLPKDKIII